MAGEENLIPFNELSEEEQRKIRSMGGKKSVEVRRKKKAMREQAEMLLSLPLKSPELKARMRKMGIDTDNLDNQMTMLVAIWHKAAKGDISAASFLRDLTGEKPAEKVEMSGEINNPFKDLSTDELRELIKRE